MEWRDAGWEAHLFVAGIADKVGPDVWWSCPVCVWLEVWYWAKEKTGRL